MNCSLYRHFDENDRLLYVGVSLNAVARLVGHRSSSHWFDDIARIQVQHFPTREKALAAEAAAIMFEKPLHNRQRPFINLPKPTSCHPMPKHVRDMAHGFVIEADGRTSKIYVSGGEIDSSNLDAASAALIALDTWVKGSQTPVPRCRWPSALHSDCPVFDAIYGVPAQRWTA